MNTRERFLAVMNFQPYDRLPLLEWASWWTETIDRWHGEGLPANLEDRYDICRYLGVEIYLQEWLRPYGDVLRPETREQRQGGILPLRGSYEKLAPRMYSDPEIDSDRWRHWAEQQERGEAVIWITLDGFFWFPREMFGVVPHLYAFYDDRELMHRMNCDLAEFNIRTIEKICSICAPDFVTFAEDMSYNHGPMLSRDLFDEFMKPYYEMVVPVLKKHGVLAIIDSDGDISTPAHWFAEAGLDGMLPLEKQSGVDIVELRAQNPGMRFVGHYDKMVMSKGEEAMRAEFERLLPTAARGGFIVSCDHQTPPGVSFQEYQVYLSLFREYAEKAGRMSRLGTGAA